MAYSVALQAVLDEAVKDGNMPGISAAIANSSGIWWQGQAGLTDLSKKTPTLPSHVFGIGSITKVFVSVVALQLVEEELISLTDKVADLLEEEIINCIPGASNATLEELLSHTSGIASWEDDPEWIREARGSQTDPARIWTKMEPLEFVRKALPDPPKGYSYSNTGFTLLGLVIEKVTGCPVVSEIRRRILDPLGLRDTYFETYESSLPHNQLTRRYHYATATFEKIAGVSPSFPHVRDGLIDVSASNLSVEWVAGGMLSSPASLVRFGLALRDGKLLKSSSMEFMFNWKPARVNAKVGLGIFRYDVEGGLIVGHNGSTLGFMSSFYWSENGDCVVAVCSNIGSMHVGVGPRTTKDIAMHEAFLKVALNK